MKKASTITIIDEPPANVTKKFYTQAMKFGTEEYKKMREFKAENPAMTIKVKQIKKNTEKETNKNMTYDNMRKFIKTLPNSENMLNELERQIERSCIKSNRYHYVLDWFKANFMVSKEAIETFNTVIPTISETTAPAYQA